MKGSVSSVVLAVLWLQSVASFAPIIRTHVARQSCQFHNPFVRPVSSPQPASFTVVKRQVSTPGVPASIVEGPEDVQDETEDPLTYVMTQWKEMDRNTVINNLLIFGVALAVLVKVSTVNFGMTRGWTAAEMALRVPIDNWASYSSVLDAAPIPTKAVTSATVYTIGDIIAQRTEGTSIGELDRMRTLRSLLAGLIAHGPMSHYWYGISEHIFEKVLCWTAWWSFFPKVILDQTTWGPFWNNTYILILGLMKRESLETIWGDVKRTTIPLVVSGLKLWPLAHCITYGLVPIENRLLWVDFVEILWVTILATQAAGGAHHHSHDAPVEDTNADSTSQVAMMNATATKDAL